MDTAGDPLPVSGRREVRLRWSILIVLAIGVMISFVDRTSISAALATPSFKTHFALSDLDRGWINSAFFWSYAVMQIPLGWVVDRYGVKSPYAICFALWCVATAATGFAEGLASLIVLRLFVGAAEAIVVPASWRWLRHNFVETQSGTAVGIYMLGSKIGPAIGAPLAAWIIIHADWRVMFLVLGLAGLVWLVPWLLLVRNDVPRVTDTARAKVSGRKILASPLIWATMVVMFCYNYFTFFCMTWMPAYLVEQRGLALDRMAAYAFFSFAGIGVVALASGYLADRLIARGHNAVGVRKGFTIAGFAVAATVVLGANTTSLNVALFWNVASLSGLGLATSNHLALCRLTLIPKSAIGVVSGFQQVATAMAGIVAPILTGWLLHVSGSYTLPIDAIFVFLVLGGLTTALCLKEEWALSDAMLAADPVA